MSASTVQGGMSANLQFNQTPTTGYQQGASVTLNPFRLSALYKPGNAADQCDTIVPLLLSLAASTPQTIDLSTLTDAIGNAVTFARLRLVAIKVQGATDGQVLTVGAATSNEFDGFLALGSKCLVYPSAINDGFTLFTAPTTTGMVVSGTSKMLKLDPGTSNLIVSILLVGCSV